MAKEKKSKLKIEIDGIRRFICVPIGKANDLHAYLRGNRVRSAPPEPSFTGFDSIELAKDVDVAAVQALLNAF